MIMHTAYIYGFSKHYVQVFFHEHVFFIHLIFLFLGYNNLSYFHMIVGILLKIEEYIYVLLNKKSETIVV